MKILLSLSAALLLTLSPAAAPAQEIAFTWDDLPSHGALPPGETRVEIGKKLISAMRVANIPPVYGFVNGIQTDREPLSSPMLQDWRDAGLLLGNHTWSHPNLNQLTLEDWEQDLVKNEPLLQRYMTNQDWRWLRYPYLAEGETKEKRSAVRQMVAKRGYKIAAVTMSFGDYMYNEPYARCVANNDSAGIALLETSYLAAASSAIEYSRAMSKALYGRDIPYVLLMHVGALDARLLPRLLQLYRGSGFSFIRLEDAEKDPFYKSALDPSLPGGPDSLEEAMQQRGLQLPPRVAPTVDVNSICK